jgi:hypothetical protein
MVATENRTMAFNTVVMSTGSYTTRRDSPQEPDRHTLWTHVQQTSAVEDQPRSHDHG